MIRQRLLPLLLLVLFAALAQGQTKPFIVKGKLTHCPEKYLRIFFRDTSEFLLIDTIQLEEDGSFYLETYHVDHPQRTSIQQNNVQFNDIYVAPGYELTITGDAPDFKTLTQTKTVSGKGSTSNRYRFLIDSLSVSDPPEKHWFEMDAGELSRYLPALKERDDSVFRAVFTRPVPEDPYLEYFKEMIQLDNLFMRQYIVLMFPVIKNYNRVATRDWVNQHADTAILNHIYDSAFMISAMYRGSFMSSAFPEYLSRLEYSNDTVPAAQRKSTVELVNEHYTGPVREYVLFRLIDGSIEQSRDIAQLERNEALLARYLDDIPKTAYRNILQQKLLIKKGQLSKLATGELAPAFTLVSNTGTTHRLTDFKGKVVYIDLWASWCGPCRAETPALKKLYDQYKTDDRIAIVSIAVHDAKADWEKALEEDQPGWLQLIDTEGAVSAAYAATAIPKFIILDKHGRIVTTTAPRPSSGETLTDLLEQEMGKQ